MRNLTEMNIESVTPRSNMLSVIDIYDEKYCLLCRFYVKNCIFQHMSDKIFQWPAPLKIHLPLLPKWRCYRTGPALAYTTTSNYIFCHRQSLLRDIVPHTSARLMAVFIVHARFRQDTCLQQVSTQLLFWQIEHSIHSVVMSNYWYTSIICCSIVIGKHMLLMLVYLSTVLSKVNHEKERNKLKTDVCDVCQWWESVTC